MSTYEVNKVCYRVQTDPSFRQVLRGDPAEALSGFRLTPEERRALLAGDVATLHRLGAFDFLLGMLARFELLGLTRDAYQERIRAVLDDPLA